MFEDTFGIMIGLFFIYLLLSLICSAVIEWISRKAGWRSNTLDRWVRKLFNDPSGGGLTRKLYNHSLIKVLSGEGRYGKPASIPPRTFVLALTDIIRSEPSDPRPSTVAEFKKTVEDSPGCHEETKGALLALLHEAGDNIERARDNIADWFDDPMGTVAQVYKGTVTQWIFCLALIFCVILNVDTFMIADALWYDSQLRTSVRIMAEDFAGRLETEELEQLSPDAARAAEAIILLSQSRMPLGWSTTPGDRRNLPKDISGWLMKILGILTSTVAASLGAPFWFDLLRKILRLGSAAKQGERASE